MSMHHHRIYIFIWCWLGWCLVD